MTILCVEGLAKRYGDRTIGPATFTLTAGEVGLVVGGSGSGKSTLLDLIYGTRVASAGTAILDTGGWRRDLLTLSVVELISIRRSTIGYCTQFLTAIPGKSGRDLARETAAPGTCLTEIEGLFEQLALPPHIWDLPTVTWSGGEKQRLNIALAALRRPRILLLDEPFASLDRPLHPIIWSFLSDLARAGTALLIGVHQTEDGIPTARTAISLAPTKAELPPKHKPFHRAFTSDTQDAR